MTRRDRGPRTASAEEVSKGCRRIVGFLFAGWFLFGIAFAFIRDNAGGFDRFDFRDIGNIAIPLAIVVFVVSLVRRNNRSRLEEDEAPQNPEPTRRVESIRVEPRQPPPLPAPSPAPRREPAGPPPMKPAPLPAPQSPPQTLEEALEELGLEPSDHDVEQFGSDLAPSPKSSQEMIDDARRKWGKGPRPGGESR